MSQKFDATSTASLDVSHLEQELFLVLTQELFKVVTD